MPSSDGSGAHTSQRLPPTSLIVCSRNRERLLVETVSSILEGDECPSEIIIIDQSDEPSDQLARLQSRACCEIRYVPSCERGVSRGRNLGAAIARHYLLVFTDDDMSAPAAWFGSLVRALLRAGPESCAVTGRVLATAPERPGAYAPPGRRDDQPYVYQGRITIDVLDTLNMALHRSLLERAGGFDQRLGPGTRFPAAEDNDLGFRLLELGCRIVYEPDATLYHRAWRNGREHLRQRWQYELGQGAFYAKHMSVSDAFMLRRMVGQIRRQATRLARTHLRAPRKSCVGVIAILGVMSGALQWKLSYAGFRRQPSAPGEVSIGKKPPHRRP